jgi:4-amino-4-deoxy-L-arabinose transferase-like glycosyltransferase
MEKPEKNEVISHSELENADFKMKKWFKENLFLIFILGASFLLGVFCINWGLPAQWHVDEKLKVETVLNMASSRSLNPHNFVNPSLHLYLLNLALLPYLVLVKSIPIANLNISLVYIISRLFSVCMGVLTVLLVYLIGKKVFDKRTGILSAIVLAITMGFVNIVHFATPEATVTFLATLTMLFCVYIVDTGELKYYLLAGACAGFAVSTKYSAWLLILPISGAFLLREGKMIYQEKLNHLNAVVFFKIMLLIGILIVVVSFWADKSFAAKFLSPDGIIEVGTIQFLGFLRRLGLFLGSFIIMSAILGKYIIPIGNLFTNICVNKKILLAVLLIAVFFLIGTPYSLLDFRSFLNSVIDDWKYACGNKDFSNPDLSWSLFALSLNNIFGTPILLLFLVGLGYGFFKAYKGNKYILLFLSWIIPFYIFLSMTHHFAMRFIIPIVPILAIFAGMITSGLLNLSNLPKPIAKVLISLILLYSFIYTITLDLMFANDSRYKASEWIVRNIAKNSAIDTYSSVEGSLPTIPKGYNIRHFTEIEDKSLNKTEFKQFLKNYQEKMGDFIILTNVSYDRYLSRPDVYPERTKFYKELIEVRSGYRLVSKFDFQGLLSPDPESVDPVILIFRKGQYITN